MWIGFWWSLRPFRSIDSSLILVRNTDERSDNIGSRMQKRVDRNLYKFKNNRPTEQLVYFCWGFYHLFGSAFFQSKVWKMVKTICVHNEFHQRKCITNAHATHRIEREREKEKEKWPVQKCHIKFNLKPIHRYMFIDRYFGCKWLAGMDAVRWEIFLLLFLSWSENRISLQFIGYRTNWNCAWFQIIIIIDNDGDGADMWQMIFDFHKTKTSTKRLLFASIWLCFILVFWNSDISIWFQAVWLSCNALSHDESEVCLCVLKTVPIPYQFICWWGTKIYFQNRFFSTDWINEMVGVYLSKTWYQKHVAHLLASTTTLRV